MAVAFANLISRQHENSKEVSFRIDITECDSGYLRTIGKNIIIDLVLNGKQHWFLN